MFNKIKRYLRVRRVVRGSQKAVASAIWGMAEDQAKIALVRGVGAHAHATLVISFDPIASDVLELTLDRMSDGSFNPQDGLPTVH
jgi:hypothetical protein